MTNREKWLIYTSGLSSPLNYLEWTWRWIISASLQRRVWLGFDNQKVFSNEYIFLVGKPGIGKGLPLKEAIYLLRFWKKKHALALEDASLTDQQKQTAAIVKEEDLRIAQGSELKPSNAQNPVLDALLIPCGPDDITYESLVESVAKSYRRIQYVEFDEKEQKRMLRTYGHSSLCFILPELGSLFRKRTDDTIKYLLGLYDCPDNYERRTKTQGEDRVNKGCLNFVAACTPSFMEEIFDNKLIDDGFASRVFLIYATKNRKNQFIIPAKTDEQKACGTELLEHLRKLTSLYGPIVLEDSTRQYLEEWFDTFCKTKLKKVSKKLESWYARLNLHVMKVALSEHFSESTEMTIPLETFKRAIEILEQEAKNMELAVVMESPNPVAKIARKILDFLGDGRQNNVEIITYMIDYADKHQLDEALSFLIETEQITTEEERDEELDRKVVYWKLIEKKI